MSTITRKLQASTPVNVIPLTAVTLQTSGNIACGQYHFASLSQTIAAIGGTTPSLAVALYGSVDGVNFYAVAGGGFTAATANGFQRMVAVDISGFQSLQYQYTLSGTSPTANVRLDIQLFT